MMRVALAGIVFIGVVGLSSCTPQPEIILVLPTLAVLPSETPTPIATDVLPATDTALPTITMPPASATALPTQTPITPTLVLTIARDFQVETLQAEMTALNATLSQYQTATLTPLPTETPTPQSQLVQLTSQAFSVRGTGQIRECPSRACEVLALLPADSVIVVDALVYGEDVDMGNDVWYRTLHAGQTGYVYSAVVVPIMPTLIGVSAPTSVPALSQPIVPLTGGICPRPDARCSELTCEQAYACLAEGNRRLDGDGNGIPCQSVCGG